MGRRSRRRRGGDAGDGSSHGFSRSPWVEPDARHSGQRSDDARAETVELLFERRLRRNAGRSGRHFPPRDSRVAGDIHGVGWLGMFLVDFSSSRRSNPDAAAAVVADLQQDRASLEARRADVGRRGSALVLVATRRAMREGNLRGKSLSGTSCHRARNAAFRRQQQTKSRCCRVNAAFRFSRRRKIVVVS